MLYISDKAQTYFIKLLNQQKNGTQIRIFLKNLNTIHPECGICYYFPKNNDINDTIIKFNRFSIYINNTIIPFIKNTKIDLVSDNIGIHLNIHSPNINTLNNNKTDNITNKLSLEDQVKDVLDFQINPQLAMHGGSISLIQITQDNVVILKFNGGCNGCAMSYYTIKEGIEKTLKRFFPQLKGVMDITQHQHGDHSYY